MGANDPVSDWVIFKPGRGVDCIADEEALPRFRRKLGSLRRVDVDKGRATEDPEVGEIGVSSSERGKENVACSLGPGTIADVNHGEEGEAP